MPWVLSDNLQYGWMNQLHHLEFLSVRRHFYASEMKNDPIGRDSIAYLPLGTILIADQRHHRHEESSGWQSVWEAVPPYRLVWVHPAILARYDMGVQVLGFDSVPPDGTVDRLNETNHTTLHVDVCSMGGRTPRNCPIRNHTGLCRLVIEAKLWGAQDKAAAGGQLIANVVRGLKQLTMEHMDICFCCEHGKHRSVAAYSVFRAMAPLSHDSCHVIMERHGRRDLRRCWAKCPPAAPEEIRVLIEAYICGSMRNSLDN